MNKKKKYLTFLNKVRNKLIHPFEKNIGNYFIHILPGNFLNLIISMFKILSRLAQPNDRWNLIIYANEWIKFSRKHQIKNTKKKIILIFCSYRGEFIYNIVLGSILSFYGNKIKIIYLPKLRSPIK